MKYYSEKTRQFFDTAEACQKAEFEAKEAENREKIRKERELALAKEKKEKEAADRKAMATEVETARKAMTEAQKVYKEKLEAFCKKYGTWHTSISNSEIPSLFNLFDFHWF